LREPPNERDELVVHYQPVVDLGEQCIAAVEAVVRWQHPERGLLEPLDFILSQRRRGSSCRSATWC
jgi:predicted signal transduction protein with EAL and GGDEF domain